MSFTLGAEEITFYSDKSALGAYVHPHITPSGRGCLPPELNKYHVPYMVAGQFAELCDLVIAFLESYTPGDHYVTPASWPSVTVEEYKAQGMEAFKNVNPVATEPK